MTENSMDNFLIDVLNIIGENVDCYIQAPSINNIAVSNLMQDSKYDYFKLIHLNKERKTILINEIATHSVQDYFQSIEIRKNDNLLFEGFDGIEYGAISNTIQLPGWFLETYVSDGICLISENW